MVASAKAETEFGLRNRRGVNVTPAPSDKGRRRLFYGTFGGTDFCLDGFTRVRVMYCEQCPNQDRFGKSLWMRIALDADCSGMSCHEASEGHQIKRAFCQHVVGLSLG